MASPASILRRLPMLSQRSRRLAVLAAFTGYPLVFIGYELLVKPGHLSTTIWGPLVVVLFAATFVGIFALYGFGQGRIGDRRSLDERQRSMTDKALVVSYGVLSTAVVVGLGFLAVAAAFRGPVTVDMEALIPFLIAGGMYIPLLPVAALAWIEPDAPTDDEA